MHAPSKSKSREQFAAEQGALVNQNNGIYVRGESYGYAKKLEVAAMYRWAREKNVKPNLNEIARECSVSWHFVNKIKNELIVNKKVLRPSVIRDNKDIVRGPGAKTLDEFDQFVLLQLHSREPSRSLKSYVQWLHEYAGTIVSESTVSRFFITAVAAMATATPASVTATPATTTTTTVTATATATPATATTVTATHATATTVTATPATATTVAAMTVAAPTSTPPPIITPTPAPAPPSPTSNIPLPTS